MKELMPMMSDMVAEIATPPTPEGQAGPASPSARARQRHPPPTTPGLTATPRPGAANAAMGPMWQELPPARTATPVAGLCQGSPKRPT
jgi:hypothetical protein